MCVCPASCNRSDTRKGKDALLLPQRQGVQGGGFRGAREPPAASSGARSRETEKWNGGVVVTDDVSGMEGV